MYMKSSLLAVAGLSCCTFALAESEPAKAGSILDDMDIIGADYGDDTAPIANDPVTRWLADFHTNLDKSRINYFIEQAYSHSWFRDPAEGNASSQSWYKLHAHLGLNLVSSERHQGTWIKAELSGSSALDPKSRKTTLDDTLGSLSNADCDVFEDGFYYMPELLISQGFANGHGVMMLGVINQTNYIDANTYANTTYGQFTAGPFVNNLVLPLGESNFGFMFQWEFNDNWFAQLGGNMLDCEGGENPFRHTMGKSFNLIGEIGWTHEDAFGIGQATYRLEPFMFHAEGGNEGGIAINMEQDLGSSPFAVFFRAGWSGANTNNPGGAEAQVSGGLIIKKPIEIMSGLKESDGNYLGLALAVVKPEPGILGAEEGEEAVKPKNREVSFQCVYCYAITPYFLIEPSYQLIHNPSQRPDTSSASVFSIQGVLTF